MTVEARLPSTGWHESWPGSGCLEPAQPLFTDHLPSQPRSLSSGPARDDSLGIRRGLSLGYHFIITIISTFISLIIDCLISSQALCLGRHTLPLGILEPMMPAKSQHPPSIHPFEPSFNISLDDHLYQTLY